MLKILVTGGKGQVGSEIKALSVLYPDYIFTFVDRDDFDLGQSESLKNYFKDKNFEAIINCAAYTAVDKAESDKDSAEAVNHHAVATLAQIAKDKKISLVHISTDYIFNGEGFRPYVESDPAGPVSVYGKTKRLGEEAIFSIAPANSIIIRTSWVYSSFGKNFLKTMLRLGKERDSLGVIFDQVGTPTYARDLAKTILDILPKIKNTDPLLYHYSNEGTASWYDFAKAIFEFSNINCTVNPITTAQYPTPATRPHYSLLDKTKIKNDFGVAIPFWRDSLKECLISLNSDMPQNG